MLFVDLKKLYGKERSKVWIHFDSASSHVAKETYAWLDKHGFNYTTKDEVWPIVLKLVRWIISQTDI